ncbi:MAG: chorismate mutase [Candidatus Zixiibacteriota bacterium]|nr:MAG: chorismate mutase [candidate division Zixibacteria bacterium]
MSEVRGIRGAIRVNENTRGSMLSATTELLRKMLLENKISPDDIASIFFTATDDLNAEYPAYAAREMGLSSVPLLCAREMNVPGSMKRLIRILIHVNTNRSKDEIKHQYLGETSRLRPDISTGGNNDDCHNEN